MTFFRTLLKAAALAVTFGSAAAAQDDPAALLADHITVLPGGTLEASGNVEVFYNGARLTAASVRYDETKGALTITGPMRLVEGGGNVVILASTAQLSDDLKEGLLQSARLVLDQQLQLAANTIERTGGRYTRLGHVVASSCQICADRPVPLWQIRASEVIHDREAQQIWFKNAQFRVGDVPILYLPWLRVPDPSLKRATGFLIPELSTSTNLGFGIEIPYFITLGDFSDLTLAPYLSSQGTTLKYRFRRNFARGGIELNGAFTQDDLGTKDTRGYLFGSGSFDLDRGYTLGFDLRATSDIDYLVDYGLYELDRLPTEVRLTRYTADRRVDARLINIRTLRSSEVPIEATLPLLLGEVIKEQRFDLGRGIGYWRLSAQGHYRTSDADVAGSDQIRFGARSGWEAGYTLPAGLRLDLDADAAADLYLIYENSTYPDPVFRVTPAASARLSWPLVRAAQGDRVETLTPMAQVAWAKTYGGDIPNTDSRLVELDPANLFDISYFPGADRRGAGVSGVLGVDYNRMSDRGMWGISMGRVWQDATAASEFTSASGLSSTRSDWLVGFRATSDAGLSLTTRALLGDDFDLTKWETRLGYDASDWSVEAVHAYVEADTEEDRPDELSELALAGDWQINRNWNVTGSVRYDINAQRATRARVGFEYRNECVEVGFGATRRFTSTTSLEPATNLELTVGLTGFGGRDGRAYRQECAQFR